MMEEGDAGRHQGGADRTHMAGAWPPVASGVLWGLLESSHLYFVAGKFNHF
jgi:hypothetical protein